jgi:hypothetical protein
MTRFFVMAGLVPAIHVFLCLNTVRVDARHKAGHDELSQFPSINLQGIEKH